MHQNYQPLLKNPKLSCNFPYKGEEQSVYMCTYLKWNHPNSETENEGDILNLMERNLLRCDIVPSIWCHLKLYTGVTQLSCMSGDSEMRPSSI